MKKNHKISALIIEDDKESIDYLTSIINDNLSEISIEGISKTIKSSVKLIKKIQPELIFMDIELKDGSAFEIFKELKTYKFEVIFITAYDNYIKKALNHYAFSVIIKPYEPINIINVARRYIELRNRLFSRHKFDLLADFLKSSRSKILLHVGNEHKYVDINDIIKCEAEGNYTKIFTNKKTNYLATGNLKHFEELLLEKGFFKANRSVLVNLNFVDSIYKKESLKLNNNEKIRVSVRNKSNLSRLIKTFS